MRANLYGFLSFCVILLGAVFLLNAGVLNRYSSYGIPIKDDTANRSASFITGTQGLQKQHALLPALETEHRIQEENRSSDRPNGRAGEFYRGIHASTLVEKDTFDKNSFLFTACSLPIYLLVRSLRL